MRQIGIHKLSSMLHVIHHEPLLSGATAHAPQCANLGSLKAIKDSLDVPLQYHQQPLLG